VTSFISVTDTLFYDPPQNHSDIQPGKNSAPARSSADAPFLNMLISLEDFI
jgi:hypothetical protein